MKFISKNDSSRKFKIVTAVVCLAVCLTLFAALMLPARNMYTVKYFPMSDDIVAQIGVENIIACNNCEIDKDGNVSVAGADAHIIFEGGAKSVQTVVLNFKKPVSKGFRAELYYDAQTEFTQAQMVTSYAFAGDSSICFNLPQSVSNLIRIDIETDYVFSSVELHENAASAENSPIRAMPYKYILCVLLSVAVTTLLLVFDNFVFPVSKRVAQWFKSNKKSLVCAVLGGAVSAAVALGAEYILSHYVFGVSSTGGYFNVFRFFFIFSALACVITLAFAFKNGVKNIERYFACLLFLTGLAMLLCTPFGHVSWDYESHTGFVIEQSFLGENLVTEADEYVISTNEFYFSKESAADNLKNIAILNASDDNVVGTGEFYTTVAHIPAGIAMALARFFCLPYYFINVLGEAANLLCYTVIFYFAMRKLSSGKAILAVVAFFPTNLFLATNYSYDWWVTAFAALGTAYFVEEFKNPQRCMALKDNIIMCAVFTLAAMPKEIYIPLLVLPFFLYKRWSSKTEKRRYYLLCVLSFVIIFILLGIRLFGSVTSGGDSRGGGDVNSGAQLAFILGNPFEYTKILLNFLKGYLGIGGMSQYIVNFAYLGIGKFAWVYIALVMLTVITDKNETDRFKGSGWLRIINIVMFFGTMCLVATSLYMAFTPVSSEVILGCQPRYIIPMLFPLLITIGNRGINLKINKNVYNLVIFVILSTAVYLNVATVMLPKLM